MCFNSSCVPIIIIISIIKLELAKVAGRRLRGEAHAHWGLARGRHHPRSHTRDTSCDH